jgi:ATP-dependent DNA helicase DinG
LVFSLQEKYREIAEQLPGYEPRPIQEAMINAVYKAIHAENTVVIEAGTGAGKSFGYLIPAMLTTQRPIVISTGTIALQEQLIQKDIPFVAKAAGLEALTVKLVKGRRNYLCLQKLQEFAKTIQPAAPEQFYISMVKSAFVAGWDGDKATLDVEIPPEIWEEMQSDSEDCLGNRCSYYAENPYRLAREDLVKADILVVNHALYLQDLVSNQSLLPPHQLVIFDEAHHLKAFALKGFTARIGKYATHKLLRKIHRRLEPVPDMYQHAIFQTESEILQWLFRHDKQTFKLYPDDEFIGCIHRQIDVLTELRAWLANFDVIQLPIVVTELDQDRALVQRQKLLSQLDNLVLRWEFFLDSQDADRVNWAEIQTDRLYYEIRSTPLNISEQLFQSLWQEKTGVLTSATLSTQRNLTSFRRGLGIPVMPENTDLILDSPFNFGEQCQLYLPPGMPDPNDSMFQPAVITEIVRILKATQGRAFILFTAYAAMQRVSGAVIPQIPFPCKVQGDLPKNRLIEWFKETPNSVLFATATFWEGIDIPGEALSCVIIDRLPFPMPDEPVHSAMIDRLKRQGEDWFNGYLLPETTIRLKQGVGRLIRSNRDCGLIAILDPRLQTKGYGKKILASLPPVETIHSLDDLTVFSKLSVL